VVIAPGRRWRVSPLADGYRFWIWPHYRLETPTVCVELTPCAGQVMALLLAHPNRNLLLPEIFEALYGFREDGGPILGSRQIPPLVVLLRQRLRAAGVDVMIDSARGRSGYVFRGFRTCEPEVGKTIARYCSWPVKKSPQQSRDAEIAPVRDDAWVRRSETNWFHNARYERVMIPMPLSNRD
jgi:hypothetical protein